MTIEEILEQPCWVIDFLPYRVPGNSGGRFFTVEDYFLRPPRAEGLKARFLAVILKLNCYYPVSVAEGDSRTGDPPPEELEERIRNGGLDLLTGDTLIRYDGGDTHMSVYNPSGPVLALIRVLAESEGLFVWKAD